ncbi:MAG: hypothetical protein COY38_04085 [Candidatus Aenigmarchaeota archaeon CG_4_10_14_0_8_um_filter_37_24]|nr:MAG: hypothetical protein COS07_04170 [Candidatus Aenigmarchaeota archaeon CG01_land_8_20_14_3_00_37_9]PIW40846.1 MAG: hypothetical protein COW21_05045 [Candidatus Aenigmarchaeota archaeon CG15_BIG_FIL_POST_REV_8_21_14_020_37_27]PIX51219.1 MAG: hypothetical protein COZ52_00070 [Candidatus Aenigmarchaeota archaeon CG_4_8_14_3_um_filter_37_24]PIY34819.1 MAG: hypothetical protein COZ04_05695 [Candidatus Aenigmarchaeota archaeon CG_4_10_14_3_um_filter_37_21]PIZ34552.1 MAG: hypothetical protein C
MRKISWNKYFSVLLITTLIFVISFLISQIISSKTSEDISQIQKDISNYLLSLNLQSEIASEYICKVDVLGLTKEKTLLGQQIEILEKSLGKENKIVKDLKKDYSLLSIRQWLLIKQFKENCNESTNIIIFFYSNKNNPSESESQGYVLDYLYQKYPEKVVVYAFDIDEDDPALNMIKKIYEVKEAPSVVVNEKLFSGFQTKEKLESLLS